MFTYKYEDTKPAVTAISNAYSKIDGYIKEILGHAEMQNKETSHYKKIVGIRDHKEVLRARKNKLVLVRVDVVSCISQFEKVYRDYDEKVREIGTTNFKAKFDEVVRLWTGLVESQLPDHHLGDDMKKLIEKFNELAKEGSVLSSIPGYLTSHDYKKALSKYDAFVKLMQKIPESKIEVNCPAVLGFKNKLNQILRL